MSSIYDNYPAVRYVDEYDKDTDEQCVRCKGNCGFIGITGMWACKGFVPMTNADKIRSMSEEELADWIAQILAYHTRASSDPHKGECLTDCPLYRCCNDQPSDNIEDWLKAPVEEVDNGQTD